MENLNLNINKKSLGPTLAKGGNKVTVEGGRNAPSPHGGANACYGTSDFRGCVGGTYDPNTREAGGSVSVRSDCC